MCPKNPTMAAAHRPHPYPHPYPHPVRRLQLRRLRPRARCQRSRLQLRCRRQSCPRLQIGHFSNMKPLSVRWRGTWTTTTGQGTGTLLRLTWQAGRAMMCGRGAQDPIHGRLGGEVAGATFFFGPHNVPHAVVLVVLCRVGGDVPCCRYRELLVAVAAIEAQYSQQFVSSGCLCGVLASHHWCIGCLQTCHMFLWCLAYRVDRHRRVYRAARSNHATPVPNRLFVCSFFQSAGVDQCSIVQKTCTLSCSYSKNVLWSCCCYGAV